jgi:hypothetical protein
MSLTLYIGNDNVLELTGLKGFVADAYINDATVTATLYDESGTEVVGQTWPMTLVHASGTDGIYRGTIEYDVAVTTAQVYTAEVDVDAGSGLIGHFESRVMAVTRRTT